MAFTFLKAKGYETGSSKVENDFIKDAKRLMGGGKIALPADVVVAERFEADAKKKVVASDSIDAGWMGLDIGPETVKLFKKELDKAKTVVWNGPLGVFEWDNFADGTVEIAQHMAIMKAVTVIGGGDTIAASKKAGVEGRFSHTSTGGGAMLELLEGKTLPAIEALEKTA